MTRKITVPGFENTELSQKPRHSARGFSDSGGGVDGHALQYGTSGPSRSVRFNTGTSRVSREIGGARIATFSRHQARPA